MTEVEREREGGRESERKSETADRCRDTERERESTYSVMHASMDPGMFTTDAYSYVVVLSLSEKVIGICDHARLLRKPSLTL